MQNDFQPNENKDFSYCHLIYKQVHSHHFLLYDSFKSEMNVLIADSNDDDDDDDDDDDNNNSNNNNNNNS